MRIDYEAELNPEQYEAVVTTEGPLLIIAGAGSGKTRVITYRIAYMLEKGIAQHAILALTFTNKAAREMAGRVKALTGKKLQNLTVSTFHAFGVQVLRDEIGRLGYRDNFSIYDEVDRAQLIKDCAREMGFNMETFDVQAAGSIFSEVKTRRVEWTRDVDSYKALYEDYQASLQVYNAVDFDDLIVLPIRIFESFPEARAAYRERYRYVMIDEFQDTSLIQYRMMRLLSEGNVCVVGDDDQSIYSWRGANYENIVQFERDFPGLRQVTLDRNYRSTTTILDAANAVIANNTSRKEKALWTPTEGGGAISLVMPENEREEGDYIARSIKEVKLRDRLSYSDFGILIRTNNLTKHLEESLLAENVPYRVSGGTSFFQRMEIKDVVSYLRVIANLDDDVNLRRIANVPRRGIGRRSLELLNAVAERQDCSLWSAMNYVVSAPEAECPEKLRSDLGDFVSLISSQREEMLGRKKIGPKVRALVDRIDYWGYLVAENQRNEKAAKWKFLNVESLIQGIETWEKDPDNLDPGLYAWLNRITLITRDDDEEDGDTGQVNLMTVHAAKGLEFDVVYIAGCEDGIMPHARAMEEGEGNLEEERRLFYVALTRARKRLTISSCRTRKLRAQVVDCRPSPFLEEIPAALVEIVEEEAALSEEEGQECFARLASMFPKPDEESPDGTAEPQRNKGEEEHREEGR